MSNISWLPEMAAVIRKKRFIGLIVLIQNGTMNYYSMGVPVDAITRG